MEILVWLVFGLIVGSRSPAAGSRSHRFPRLPTHRGAGNGRRRCRRRHRPPIGYRWLAVRAFGAWGRAGAGGLSRHRGPQALTFRLAKYRIEIARTVDQANHFNVSVLCSKHDHVIAKRNDSELRRQFRREALPSVDFAQSLPADRAIAKANAPRPEDYFWRYVESFPRCRAGPTKRFGIRSCTTPRD